MNINNISSGRTRHAFQKRLIERVEEECIFVELIDTGDSVLDADEIHSKAVLLIQRSSDDEILRLIGNTVPVAGVQLLTDVRSYSIKQLPETGPKAASASATFYGIKADRERQRSLYSEESRGRRSAIQTALSTKCGPKRFQRSSIRPIFLQHLQRLWVAFE